MQEKNLNNSKCILSISLFFSSFCSYLPLIKQAEFFLVTPQMKQPLADIHKNNFTKIHK